MLRYVQDYVKRRSMPVDLKCRMVLPSGAVSMSLWDAPNQEELQAWLDTYLAEAEPGLVSTVHEVQVMVYQYRHHEATQVLRSLRRPEQQVALAVWPSCPRDDGQSSTM